MRTLVSTPSATALELAEHGTRSTDAAAGVTDETWADARLARRPALPHCRHEHCPTA
ncbi:hypothetical protein ACFQYP_18410 [Nonomuraea antimicrobica]